MDRLFNKTQTEIDLTSDTGKLHLYVKEDDNEGGGEAVTDFFKQFSESSKQEEKKQSNEEVLELDYLADSSNEAFDDKSESKDSNEEDAKERSLNEALDDKSESKDTDEEDVQERSLNEAFDDKSESKENNEDTVQERSLNGEDFEFEILKPEETGKFISLPMKKLEHSFIISLIIFRDGHGDSCFLSFKGNNLFMFIFHLSAVRGCLLVKTAEPN